MGDIFDRIEKLYRYPTKSQLVEAIEERVRHKVASYYRDNNAVLPYVTLESGEYRAVSAFVDEVEEWARRTGTRNPIGPWKTVIGINTHWGFVEIKEEA